MTTSLPALLKPQEAGLELGLSRATVYRLIAAGELLTVGVGARNATRIERSEIDRYIAANRRKAVKQSVAS